MYTATGTYQSGNYVLDRGFFNFDLRRYPRKRAPESTPVTSTDRVPTPTNPATDPDLQNQTSKVPLRPQPRVTYVPPSVRHYMDGEGDQESGFQWWWTHVVHGPMNVLEKVWITTRMAVGWVVWNYTDWVSEFSKWDGTWTGLLTESHLIWRSTVVGLLTLGMLEVAPLIEILIRWFGMMFELMRVAFRLGAEGLEELWYLLGRVYEDLKSLINLF